MIDFIKQTCQSYYDQIPPETLRNTTKSALYSFAASIIYSGSNEFSPLAKRSSLNIFQPLFHAGAAALASLIYALTMPIFNWIFGDNLILFRREFLKNIVNLTLTSVAISYFTTSKVNLVSVMILGMASFNSIVSYLNIVSRALDSTDPAFANFWRMGMQWLGLEAQPGTGSVFLMFRMPAI